MAPDTYISYIGSLSQNTVGLHSLKSSTICVILYNEKCSLDPKKNICISEIGSISQNIQISIINIISYKESGSLDPRLVPYLKIHNLQSSVICIILTLKGEAFRTQSCVSVIFIQMQKEKKKI